MNFRLPMSVRPLSHRLIGLCTIATLLAGIFPLPLGSSRPVAKDQSQPFPCQHHRCGCRSAAQCWKKCCCFTNQQKVAWAKKNKVSPPGFVIAAAKAEQTDAKPVQACCHTAKPKRECTSGKCDRDHKTAPTAVEHSSDVVISSLAQRCRGESSIWHALPWTILPTPVALSADVDPVIDDWTLRSEASHGIALRPPVPPPRTA